MEKQTRGMLLMALCVMLWSFTGLLAKAISWNGMALAGCRGLISALMLFIYMRVCGTALLHSKRCLLMGLCVAAAAIFCLMANKLTAAANVIMLQYTAPVFLILFSALFYKKKYKRADYIVVTATLTGIVLFFCDELTFGNIIGNLLALALGMSYGGMFLISENVSQEERLSGILWGFVLTGLIGAPMLFLTPNAMNTKNITLVLLMAVVFYALPYILYAFSLRDCPALAAILISTLEIILNPIWVYLFLGELPGKWAFFGSALILIAVTSYSVIGVKNAKNTDVQEKKQTSAKPAS